MSKQVHILTHVNEKRLKKGEYIVSIDVVPSKSVNTTLQYREKEGYELHECLQETGKSSATGVDLKSDHVSVKFEITGALCPRVDLVQGEDTLKYTGGKHECHRKIELVRNSSSSSDLASIVYRNGDDFLHRVNIHVPKDNVTSTGQGKEHADVGVNVMAASGGGGDCVDAKLEAKPFPAGSPPDVIPDISTLTLDPVFGKTDAPLNDVDLIELARAIGPHDGRSLPIRLHVADCDVKAIFDNHPRNVVAGIYECLISWRNQHKEIGYQKMLTMLVDELRTMGRNDLVEAITTAYTRNPKLAPYLAK